MGKANTDGEQHHAVHQEHDAGTPARGVVWHRRPDASTGAREHVTGINRSRTRECRIPGGVTGIPGCVSELEHDGLGRNETTLERADRNLVELLQEVRVAQTGVQVLFGFLLMAPLTNGWRRLASALQAEYFVTLLLAAAGAILLIAPTAYHRVLFRQGDKEFLVGVANRLTIAGLAAVGLAMVGSIAFVAGILFPAGVAIAVGALACSVCVVLWAILPLVRRRSISDAPVSGGASSSRSPRQRDPDGLAAVNRRPSSPQQPARRR